jgi:hypothetical protein
MDSQTMLAELAGMMDVFQKPFAAKGMLFNYNIPFLDSVFEKVLFVQIKRDLVTNVASVLDARKRQLGSEAAWYSFKIPEYDALKDLGALPQAAGQIHCINRAVSAGMKTVAEERKLVVQYEDFCANPRRIFEEIVTKLELGKAGKTVYSGPTSFAMTRANELPSRADISRALAEYADV